MAYSTISKPSLHFNTKLYSGTGSTQNITGVGFQPDLVWLKRRSADGWHFWTDAIRGVTKTIFSNRTEAESTESVGLTAFGTDGFTVGSNADINGNGQTHVGWNWKANGAGSANTDGSISSTVSANTTAGFSIVKYTGTGSVGNIGHGLGATPKVIIKKKLSGTDSWNVWHKSIGDGSKALYLSSNVGEDTNSNYASNVPTNSLFYVGTDGQVNSSGGTYIAYCFAEKKGYSKFGSYTGNGSADGTFVYTGFKPAFIIVKRTDDTHNWWIWDNKRDPENLVNQYLYANTNSAEGTDTWGDFLSNGFKLRMNYSGGNASGGTYIYMAFAEQPLVANVGSGVPATAR